MTEAEKALRSKVFESLGAASVCWENPGGAGAFHSDQAVDIGEKLIDWIQNEWAKHEA